MKIDAALIKLIDNLLAQPIAMHGIFIDITDSIVGGYMLSQAFYWSKRTTTPDGWFWKTQKEWQKETRLTRREQDSARKILLGLYDSEGNPVWEEKLKGVPAKLHFRLNLEALYRVMAEFESAQEAEKDSPQFGGNVQTGLADAVQTGLAHVVQTSLATGVQTLSTENTSETTTETTIIDHGDERATDGTSQAAASEASSVMAAVQAPTPSCAAPLPVEHTIVASTETPAPYVSMKEAMARAQAVIDAAVKETTPSVVLPPVDPQIAALTKILTDVGVGVNSYTFDLYKDLVVEHGLPAVIAGIKIAAENGKQQSFKYVSACVVNAAKGTTNVSHKHAGSTNGQASHASGSGSGQGAGEDAGRKPRRVLDPAKVALFSGRSV